MWATFMIITLFMASLIVITGSLLVLKSFAESILDKHIAIKFSPKFKIELEDFKG